MLLIMITFIVITFTNIVLSTILINLTLQRTSGTVKIYTSLGADFDNVW